MGKAKNSTAVMAPSADDWQARDDLRTLAEARAIKADPKRRKAAAEMAKKQMLAAAEAAAEAEDNDD